jgi:hypothetical protein
VAKFAPWPFYPLGEISRCTVIVLRARFGRFGEEKPLARRKLNHDPLAI